MTIAQKIAELAEALGVDIPNDGQIADNLNAITLAKGGTITSNTNISEAIKNLANTIGGNDGGGSNPEELTDTILIERYLDNGAPAYNIIFIKNITDTYLPSNAYTDIAGIYFGDEIDNSDIWIESENYNAFRADDHNVPIGVNPDTVYGSGYIVSNKAFCACAVSRSEDVAEIESAEPGTPIHIIFTMFNASDNQCIYQCHGVLPDFSKE